MLISEYLEKIRRADNFSGHISVLDIGCGKGGDLNKWHKVRCLLWVPGLTLANLLWVPGLTLANLLWVPRLPSCGFLG